MNYDEAITAALASLKQDTRIVQPYRNYAIKHLMEAQADIRMGLTTSRRQPEGRVDGSASSCNCPMGVHSKDCPVHGSKA